MADKFLKQNNGVLEELSPITVSAGATDAGKIPALNAAGQFDPSFIEGSDVSRSMMAFEALAAGDFINLYNDAGTIKLRKTDANGKPADGFVLTAIGAGASGVAKFEGVNSQLAGLTPGTTYYLSNVTPGGVTNTPPTTAGHLVQKLGIALSATEILFEPHPPIKLA